MQVEKGINFQANYVNLVRFVTTNFDFWCGMHMCETCRTLLIYYISSPIYPFSFRSSRS